jgi:hypothetical protein
VQKLGLLLLGVIAVCSLGCAPTEVTEADSQKMKQEFSQENYEKAMKAAGKEKELEEQKAREAARNDGQVEGPQ